MSFSVVRFPIAFSVVVVSTIGLVGCSGGSSSAGVTASPGAVPQIGQIVAEVPLSEGGHEASRCGGVDDAVRDALRESAYERGWVIYRFSAEGEGCWKSAEMTVHEQTVKLAIDADHSSSTASLRVKDITGSSSSAPLTDGGAS